MLRALESLQAGEKLSFQLVEDLNTFEFTFSKRHNGEIFKISHLIEADLLAVPDRVIENHILRWVDTSRQVILNK